MLGLQYNYWTSIFELISFHYMGELNLTLIWVLFEWRWRTNTSGGIHKDHSLIFPIFDAPSPFARVQICRTPSFRNFFAEPLPSAIFSPNPSLPQFFYLFISIYAGNVYFCKGYKSNRYFLIHFRTSWNSAHDSKNHTFFERPYCLQTLPSPSTFRQLLPS